jgi:hypothetical protein
MTTTNVELLSNIPSELRTPPLWLQYYLAKDPKKPDKKPGKHPCVKYSTPEYRKANLRSLDKLLERTTVKHDGFQRYVDKAEGFVYIDLDKVRNPDSGEVEPWASKLIEELDSYTEVSASGKGFHIVCQGTLEEDFHLDPNPVEIYSGNIPNKLLAMTGDVYDLRVAISNRQEKVEELLRRVKGVSAPQPTADPSAAAIIDEPEIKDEDEVLPEFPRLPGALGQLVEGITNDIPYEHKALAAITYMGIGLARRVSLVPDHWLQPRFYACLVATASAGKSAAEFEVRRALTGDVLKDVYVELSIDSGPALVQALQENRRLILSPDELADQFEKARAGATGRNSLFGELLRLFESNETGNHTKQRKGEGGRVELHDALFALIGGTTTERFERMFQGTGAVASGLQSRFVLSYSEQRMPRLKTPNDDESVRAACADLSRAVNADGLRLRLSEAAQDAIMDWRPFEDDGAEKMKRVLDMAKRFALVVAASQQSTGIDESTMRLALQFADYQIALREKLFPPDAATHVQAFENRILKFFERNARSTQQVAINKMRPELSPGGYTAHNAAWAALVRAGRLKVAGKTRVGTAVYEL